MGREPEDAVAGERGPAPPMLRQPADAPPALSQLGSSDQVVLLRRVLADRNARTRWSFRAWAGRVSGRTDRRLLLALAGATDAVVTHCDLLTNRLSTQETVTADVAGAFGQEIALLRAEVLHLQRSLTALQDPEA
jgi:hypothetical protein